MRGFLPVLLSAAVVTAAATTPTSFAGLVRREELQTCSDLTISNNNGGRKVVIVIDSSGSMAGTDPADLRLTAARALNNFLISNSEASGGVKADQVAVVGFNSTAYTVFEPGDPGDPKANQAISTIEASGGTFIAGGVFEAIDKIAAMSGPTKDRSAIVVYTDGSDFDTDELVNAIKNATSLGIRVSFGFLDDQASAQPEEVLLAVRDSKGVYATITVAAGSINFVNYVLLNGLAYQDNPQGAGDRLLAGLASTQFITGSSPVTMKYLAEQGEKANFTLVSFTGDTVNMEARMGGKTLNSTASASRSTSRRFMQVTPPGGGEVEIVVTASNSPKDGLFSIVTGSSAPIKNCTVGVTGNNTGGLSTGAKAGLGVGIAAAVLGLAGAGFAAYKHFLAGGNTTAPPPGGNTTAPTAGHGETTGYYPGAEKIGPETTTTSIPPNHTGGGFEGNLTGQGMPPDGPPGGPHTGGPPPMGMPPNAYAAIPPFVPPVLPPMSPNQTGKDSSPHTGYQQPYGPGNQYQQPIGDYNGYQNHMGDSNSYQNHTGDHNGYQTHMGDSNSYQNHMGDHNGYQNHIGDNNGYQNHTGQGNDSYQHTGSPFQGNSTDTGTPFSDGNTTSGPYSSPNHTGFDSGGNHTSWAPVDPSNPSTGPSPAPPPFFTMPSPPTWQQQQPAKEERRHHHHEWLAPDTACEHPDCPLVASGHQCSPSRETCVCKCRDANCVITKRGM